VSGSDVLPDLLAEGLDVVFVGSAAGRRSAELGAYYARPGNRFWPTLHAIGLTPRLFAPHEFRELLPLGIGLTDVCKSSFGSDHEIAPGAFEPARLTETIGRFRPRAIAFTSKKAASVWLGRPTGAIALGRQLPEPDLPEVFVLTSPSGAGVRYWDIGPWRALASWLSHARTHPATER
jgi:double-stranded uracil-DNA glycosylase